MYIDTLAFNSITTNKPQLLRTLPCLPPHPPNPHGPIPHILPLTNPLNSKPLPSELLITRHTVHKTMTSATKPRHTIQHPLIMPPLLNNLRMHPTRNQMVIRERDPVALADLARVRARTRPRRRASRHARCVLCQHRCEEIQ